MIYVNDVLPDLRDPNWEFLKKELDEIRKMPSPFRIKISRLPVIEKGAREGMNPTGVKEPVKTFQWPLMETITRNGMTETWIYTKNRPNVRNGEIRFGKNKIEIKDGLLSLDPQTETDLIYFLTRVSTFLKKRNFVVEDLEKEAEKKINSISPDAMLIFYLNSPLSPLFNKSDQIRELAYSWGIANADKLGINQLKLVLKDTVLSSERNIMVTNRGISDFMEEVQNMGRMTKYRSLLQKAKDKNLIGFDDRQNSWCWKSRVTGEFVDYILPVLPTNIDRKDALLFEYMINNAQLFDQIEEMLANKNEGNSNEDGGLTWTELRELAKDKGISTFKKTKEQIKLELGVS